MLAELMIFLLPIHWTILWRTKSYICLWAVLCEIPIASAYSRHENPLSSELIFLIFSLSVSSWSCLPDLFSTSPPLNVPIKIAFAFLIFSPQVPRLNIPIKVRLFIQQNWMVFSIFVFEQDDCPYRHGRSGAVS